MRLFDTHCHVDLYTDPAEVIWETEKAQVLTVAVTNTPSVFRQCASLCEGNKSIRVALGLHPQLVAERHTELDLMFEMLGETRYIGEVGLDFVTKDQRDRTLQTRVFSSILERCASSKDKVFTIHSRRAAAEVVSLVGEGYPGTMILHWFSGTLTVLDKAVSHGFYFSINPSMLATIKGVQLIAAMPRDRILTESDGPFTTTDGRPTRPRDVEHVISGLAGLWKTDKREVAEKLYTNFCTALDGPRGTVQLDHSFRSTT